MDSDIFKGITLFVTIICVVFGAPAWLAGYQLGRVREQQAAVAAGVAEYHIDPLTGDTWLVYRTLHDGKLSD